MPAPLSRNNPHLSKKDFGHVLIIAGSPSMLGAAALSSLAAMRSGCGMVTAAVPQGLNLTLQKKISPVIMTLPVAQTNAQTFALPAYKTIEAFSRKCQALAIGPGMGQHPQTQKLILKIIEKCLKPLVIDADALNALSKKPRGLA